MHFLGTGEIDDFHVYILSYDVLLTLTWNGFVKLGFHYGLTWVRFHALVF